MNVKIVNEFISAILQELEFVTKWSIKVGKPQATDTLFSAEKASIFFGVSGDIKGQVIISFDENSAKKLASIMNMNMSFVGFNGLARNALEEFSAKVMHRAVNQLAAIGYGSYTTPPAVIIGEKVFISTGLIQTLIVPVFTSGGNLWLNLGLRDVIEYTGYDE